MTLHEQLHPPDPADVARRREEHRRGSSLLGVLGAIVLDTEDFSGPFDLLLAMVMGRQFELLDVEMAAVTTSRRLAEIRSAEPVDLEIATDLLTLLSALLELKSRMLLPGADDLDLVDELDSGSSELGSEELFEILLYTLRFRRAAQYLTDRFDELDGVRFRDAPLPRALARIDLSELEAGVFRPERLGRAIGRLLHTPRSVSTRHLTTSKVSIEERRSVLRSKLKDSGHTSFEETVAGADRQTVCVTMFAMLEMYKSGEATWTQDEAFGPIEITARPTEVAGRANATGTSGARQGRGKASG